MLNNEGGEKKAIVTTLINKSGQIKLPRTVDTAVQMSDIYEGKNLKETILEMHMEIENLKNIINELNSNIEQKLAIIDELESLLNPKDETEE